ncbi:MAG TPA: hypothetical protein VJR89_43105 [Polyangiales bacterium]|nr:hypothetical protein [Polyangiales bacterium]
MDQPLWQILANIALLGFVLRRAAFGLALGSAELHPALWGAYVLLCAVCAFAAVAILLSRRWVIAGLVALGVGFSVTTFVELAAHVAPAAWLLAQLVVGLAGTAGLLTLAVRNRPAQR